MGALADLWWRFRSLIGKGETVDWPTASEPGFNDDPRAKAQDIVKANFGDMEGFLRDLVWKNGWYEGAARIDAHPLRLGGSIVPRSVVVHTTDMYEGFRGLIKRWPAEKGEGNAAHFLLGRTAKEGLVQFAPITRNANHAGGKTGHGWYVDAERVYHPNLVAIGIEVDNAGRLIAKGSGKSLRLVHKDSGRELPIARCFQHTDGTWWEAWTPYQERTLRQLVSACVLTLKEFSREFPAHVSPNGDYKLNGVPWAQLPGVNVVGHATLDPNRKTDPGPQITAWIKEHF